MNLTKIKSIAATKRITLKQVAVDAGITPTRLSRIIKLNTTSPRVLERIARALDVPVTVFHEEDVEEEIKEVAAVTNDQNQAIYQSNLAEDYRERRQEIKRFSQKNKAMKSKKCSSPYLCLFFS